MQGFRPESFRGGIVVLGGAAGLWMLAVRAPGVWMWLVVLAVLACIFLSNALFRENRAEHFREDVETIKVCASEANLLALRAAVESTRAFSVEDQARAARSARVAQTSHQLVEKRLRSLEQGRGMMSRQSDQIVRLTEQIKQLNADLSA